MTETNDIQVVGDKELATVQPLLEQAKDLAGHINNDESYTLAGDLLGRVKQARKAIATILDPFVQRSHKKWKEDIAERDKYDKPLSEAIDILNKPLADYYNKKEEERQAEQRRLEAEAKKQAEDEALAYAEQLAKDGQVEAADEVISQPLITAPVVAPSTMPKVNGMSFTEYWSAEVTDLMALVKAVAANKVPLTAISENATFLNNQARALHKQLNYPGVAVRCEKRPTNRR